MSFSVIIPCNCVKEGTINYPDFWDKLRVFFGEIEVKDAYRDDKELTRKVMEWQFCEHQGIALEYHMSQSVTRWNQHIEETYPNRFLNFKKFIPDYNMYVRDDYDKKQALIELEELHELEGFVHEYRFNQFKELLETAIELDQEIYW